MDRLMELSQISKMRKLSKNETEEFNTLARIKQEAANNPAVVAARAAAQQQATQRNTEQAFQTIFSTVVELSGEKYLAIDSTANRQMILSFIHPGESVPDPAGWWTRIFLETPSLAKRIAWQEHLTPAQKVLQQKDEQKRLRERFELACRTHGLDPSEANYRLWSSTPDPVVSWFQGKPVIVLEDGTTLDLVPATQEQKDQWQQESAQKKFNENQAKLKDMALRGDVQGLHRAAQAEYAEKHNPLTVLQQRIHKELQTQYQRDTQAGFRDPLPAIFTKKQIYTWDAAEMRKQIGRYGASRITARIHDLKEIPDGNGGTIKFE